MKCTLKLMIGVNTNIMLMELVVGFGMNEFIKLYLKALSTLRYIGAAYLVYLAYKFLRTLFKKTDDDDRNFETAIKPYRIIDGVMLESTNPKV